MAGAQFDAEDPPPRPPRAPAPDAAAPLPEPPRSSARPLWRRPWPWLALLLTCALGPLFPGASFAVVGGLWSLSTWIEYGTPARRPAGLGPRERLLELGLASEYREYLHDQHSGRCSVRLLWPSAGPQAAGGVPRSPVADSDAWVVPILPEPSLPAEGGAPPAAAGSGPARTLLAGTPRPAPLGRRPFEGPEGRWVALAEGSGPVPELELLRADAAGALAVQARAPLERDERLVGVGWTAAAACCLIAQDPSPPTLSMRLCFLELPFAGAHAPRRSEPFRLPEDFGADTRLCVLPGDAGCLALGEFALARFDLRGRQLWSAAAPSLSRGLPRDLLLWGEFAAAVQREALDPSSLTLSRFEWSSGRLRGQIRARGPAELQGRAAFDGRRLAVAVQRGATGSGRPKPVVFDFDGPGSLELWPHGPHPFRGNFDLCFAAPGQLLLMLPALPLDDSRLSPAWAEVHAREQGLLRLFDLTAATGG